MKAELIPEEVFTLKVGAHQVEHMRVISKWNGLIELRNAEGEVLIVSKPDTPASYVLDTLFSGVFRTAEETKALGTEIVMGSPGLVARLRAAPAAQGEGGGGKV